MATAWVPGRQHLVHWAPPFFCGNINRALLGELVFRFLNFIPVVLFPGLIYLVLCFRLWVLMRPGVKLFKFGNPETRCGRTPPQSTAALSAALSIAPAPSHLLSHPFPPSFSYAASDRGGATIQSERGGRPGDPRPVFPRIVPPEPLEPRAPDRVLAALTASSGDLPTGAGQGGGQ